MKYKGILPFVLASFTLVACGGGSGGNASAGTTTSAPVSSSTTSTSSTTTTSIAPGGPAALATYTMRTVQVPEPGCGSGSVLRVIVTASIRAMFLLPGSVTLVTPAFSDGAVGEFDSDGVMTVDLVYPVPDVSSPYTVTFDWAGNGHVAPPTPVEVSGTWNCPA